MRQGLLENEVRSSGEIGRGGSESEKEVQEVFRYSYRVFYLVYDITLIFLILSVGLLEKGNDMIKRSCSGMVFEQSVKVERKMLLRVEGNVE